MTEKSKRIKPEAITQDENAKTIKEEFAALQQQELDASSKKKEHVRKEKLRDVVSIGVLCLVVLAFILVAVAFVCVTWHYLAPETYRWMSDRKLEVVSSILVSGPIFALLSSYVRDRI